MINFVPFSQIERFSTEAILDIQTSIGLLLNEVTEGFCELIQPERASEYLKKRGITKYFGTRIDVAEEVST